MEAIRSSETSVLTTITRHQIPEDEFLQVHRRENLKSYIYNRSLFEQRNMSTMEFRSHKAATTCTKRRCHNAVFTAPD
jgi:hypothetical protein